MAAATNAEHRIVLSAGEASGDAYGAALVREIRRLRPDSEFNFEGLGSHRLSREGVKLVADTTTWGAISITESVKVFFRVLAGGKRLQRVMRSGPPGLFIPIDFGFANIRLARSAHASGWKVLYFVPPGSWRRDRQGGDLANVTDAISTPFSWSAEILKGMGANAYWFGHPIKQLLLESLGPPSSEPKTRVAVLPGSRKHEISENLPVIAAAIKIVNPPVVEFGLAPSVNVAKFKARWERLCPGRSDDIFTVGATAQVFSRARAAYVCSGTATLEAALCRCPMVVVYRISKLMKFETDLIGFKRPQFVALPNIFLQRFGVPELIQEQATPEALAEALQALLVDGPARVEQATTFREIEQLLGPTHSVTKTAELAMSLVEGVPFTE